LTTLEKSCPLRRDVVSWNKLCFRASPSHQQRETSLPLATGYPPRPCLRWRLRKDDVKPQYLLSGFALTNVQALAIQTMQAMQAMQEILLLSVIGISETLSGSSP